MALCLFVAATSVVSRSLIGVNVVIYINIKELIRAKKVQWGRKITMAEVAETTGISRMTLFRMANNQGYNTVTDHLDKLCAFFECEIQELVQYVPQPLTSTMGKSSC